MSKDNKNLTRIRPISHIASKDNMTEHEMKKYRDLSGQVFGCFKVIQPIEERKNGYIVYLCECSCGRPNCRKTVYRSSRQLRY